MCGVSSLRSWGSFGRLYARRKKKIQDDVPIRLLCPPQKIKEIDVDLRRGPFCPVCLIYLIVRLLLRLYVCVCVWLDLFKHVSALCSFLFEWFSLYTIDFWIDKRCPPSSSHSSSRCVRQAATCSIVLVLLHVCTCHYLSIVLVAPIFSSGAVVESSGLGLGRLWCATWCGVCESERMSHAEAVGECRVENVL